MAAEHASWEPGPGGYYGEFGGSFVPEILHETLAELREAFDEARQDPAFWGTYTDLMSGYAGRPTPVTHCPSLTRLLGGAKVYVKREDLNHTGAHKVNNVMGQGLLAQRMGKRRVIAETGAGQHGVATATMAARLGLACTIYMGEEDVARQYPNVFWMRQLGAEVVAVKEGNRTLKDAINACLRDWAESMHDTLYVLGTVCGPHPFPQIVTYFQSIIGQEARGQMLEVAGQLPSRVYACVGGGSNASGIFTGFLDDPATELIGVEAGGRGPDTGLHASRLAGGQGTSGVAQGYRTVFLQNEEGLMHDTYSVAAGLDYIGIGPLLAHLHQTGRVRFESATDDEVVESLRLAMRHEGLVPALESAHAFAAAFREVPDLSPQDTVLINQSGRGDKDIFTVADALGDEEWREFLRQRAAGYDA
ncbi:tryptophan synthase subunit beta [Nocardioides campestrisoli]|uniref:tryptophan synthase subunit beta n=1 Tax=Nocardioides campestrisoli TaxID=2736757 RepID=UPI00163D7978|nr:tryptophan synthase subunit beta [Nocardioides campestrisoli]